MCRVVSLAAPIIAFRIGQQEYKLGLIQKYKWVYMPWNNEKIKFPKFSRLIMGRDHGQLEIIPLEQIYRTCHLIPWPGQTGRMIVNQCIDRDTFEMFGHHLSQREPGV